MIKINIRATREIAGGTITAYDHPDFHGGKFIQFKIKDAAGRNVIVGDIDSEACSYRETDFYGTLGGHEFCEWGRKAPTPAFATTDAENPELDLEWVLDVVEEELAESGFLALCSARHAEKAARTENDWREYFARFN